MAEKQKKTQKELHEEDPERFSDEDSDGGEDDVDGASGGGGGGMGDLLKKMMHMKLHKGKSEKKEKPKVAFELDPVFILTSFGYVI